MLLLPTQSLYDLAKESDEEHYSETDWFFPFQFPHMVR
jgi:hypothetical protein